MNPRKAKSLDTLLEQVNEMFPGRDKSSDGWIGDQAHSARKSDHNPNKAGVVTAIDIDADLSDTQKVSILVGKLRNSRDPRIKYIIYSGQITVAGSDLQKWKQYNGANAHRHHAHISVSSDPKLYDDPRPFDLSGKLAAPVAPLPAAKSFLLKRGMNGPDVVNLQTALRSHGYRLTIDGDFGPATERAVRSFQNQYDLRADGIVGDKTAKELSL